MLNHIDGKVWGIIIAGLVAAILIGPNPASSVGALAVVLACSIADKYYTNSFFDAHDAAIEKLQSDFVKLKEKQDKTDLSAAFKPRG